MEDASVYCAVVAGVDFGDCGWRMARLANGVAAVALFLLGITYGQGAVRMPGVECDLRERFSGSLERVYRIEENRAQYVVQQDGGCTLLVTTGRWPEYAAGDVIEIEGKVEKLDKIPEEYGGYADYLKRRGMGGTLRYGNIVVVEEKESPGLRRALYRRIEKLFPEPEASLVQAMVLGERGTIPEEITEQFRRTGVSHILAISGLHISIIAGGLYALALWLPLKPWTRTVLVLLLLWGYVALISWPVSSVRAAAFWTLVLAAFRLRRLVSLTTIILITAALMVSINPLVLFEVGFQLSFSAVTGIGLALFLLRENIPKRWQQLLVVSAGASLATWPLVSYHFGLISLVSIVANILVVPVVPFFLLLALAAIGISFVAPPLALAGTLGGHGLWLGLDWVTSFLASFRFAALNEVTIPAWGVALFYAAVLLGAHAWLKHVDRGWREIWG